MQQPKICLRTLEEQTHTQEFSRHAASPALPVGAAGAPVAASALPRAQHVRTQKAGGSKPAGLGGPVRAAALQSWGSDPLPPAATPLSAVTVDTWMQTSTLFSCCLRWRIVKLDLRRFFPPTRVCNLPSCLPATPSRSRARCWPPAILLLHPQRSGKQPTSLLCLFSRISGMTPGCCVSPSKQLSAAM